MGAAAKIGAVDAEEHPSAELHPLVSGFSDAENYDRGRPPYGEQVARVLIEQLALDPGAPVLELGAGTGQLSRALVAAGLDLTAVEPLGPTRELLCRAIGERRVRAGAAERIPLGEGSVAAVFAADAFHWFDESRAMPEIRRVLAPGGGMAILRTVPVLEQAWSQELGAILNETRPDHPAFVQRGAAAALDEDSAFGPVTETTVTSRARWDRERMLAYVASFSWVATLPPPARSELLARVEDLLDRHGVEEARHDVLHQIWVARLA